MVYNNNYLNNYTNCNKQNLNCKSTSTSWCYSVVVSHFFNLNSNKTTHTPITAILHVPTYISVLPRIFRVVVGFYIAFSAVYPVYTQFCLSSLYLYYLRGG